ncbi:MAG: hypothetical protein ACOYL5_02115, partial [Phototrophicaceae bacterium]
MNRKPPKDPLSTTGSFPVVPKKFMDFVQHHERTWGTDSYVGRPDLATILEAVVVSFWSSGDGTARFKVKLHNNTEEIERYMLRLLIGLKFDQPNEKLVAVYRYQRRLAVSNVTIQFRESA